MRLYERCPSGSGHGGGSLDRARRCAALGLIAVVLLPAGCAAGAERIPAVGVGAGTATTATQAPAAPDPQPDPAPDGESGIEPAAPDGGSRTAGPAEPAGDPVGAARSPEESLHGQPQSSPDAETDHVPVSPTAAGGAPVPDRGGGSHRSDIADGPPPADDGPPPEARQAGTARPAGHVEVAPGPAEPVTLVSALDGDGPPPEVAAAILDAYVAFWASYWAAAGHPVNPEHPGIARHSTEPLRSRTVGVLLGRATEGVALALPDDHGAGRVVRIEGWDAASAEILDCFVDNAVLYEVSTGRVRNDERATVVHLALMRREGNSWRVSEIFEQAVHTGRTDGCTMQANTHEAAGPTGTAAAPAPDGEAGGAEPGSQPPS